MSKGLLCPRGRASPQALYRAFSRGRENLLTPLCLFSTAQTLCWFVRWFWGGVAWQSLWLFDAAEQDDSEDFQPFPRPAARYETGSDTAKLHKLPE